MRKLMSRSVLTRGAAAGAVTALLCVPYICLETPAGDLRSLRIAFLFPVCILLYQVGIAWTPVRDGDAMFRKPDRRGLQMAAAAGLGLGLLKWLAVDLWLQKWAPGSRAETMVELLAEMPWVALFQPLAVVAGVYGFTVRLSRRPLLAVFMVILAYQGLLATQLDAADIPSGPRLSIVLLAGAVGLVCGTLYRRMGWSGPVLVCALVHLRHALRILW